MRELPSGTVTFPPGTSYDSENYRWFGARHDDFYYLDRIVFDSTYRRRGLATLCLGGGGAVALAVEMVSAPPALDPTL